MSHKNLHCKVKNAGIARKSMDIESATWLPQIKGELQYTTVIHAITHQYNLFYWKAYVRTWDGATMYK